MSDFYQWLGFWITFIGTVISIIGLWVTWLAYKRVKSAELAAKEARDTARRQVRIGQLKDLAFDIQEIQAMISESNLTSVAAKAAHLRARIVQFKGEAYNELQDSSNESLDIVRDQLEIINRAVASTKSEQNKLRAIQLAYAIILESAGRAIAIQTQSQGES